MGKLSRRRLLAGTAATLALGRTAAVRAAASGPGISANEIKLGTTAYYSGLRQPRRQLLRSSY